MANKRLTKKEKGFVKDYLKTGNGTRSALNNYDTTSENTAAVIASENIRKPHIKILVEDAFPDEMLFEIHKQGLKSTKVISANITYGEADEKTNDFIEVPDHQTIHKYLDTAYKLKGSFAPEKHDITTQGDKITDNAALEAAAKVYGKATIKRKTT